MPAAASPPVTSGSWSMLLERLRAADMVMSPMERREFKPPELPPGVVPAGRRNPLAMDSANATYGYLNAQSGELCNMGFPGYPYLSNLAQRSEYRAPTETIAGEMTREWIKFTGADDAQTKELTKAFKDFAIRDVVRLAIMHDGFFGRGQVYIQIKGQDSDKARRRPLVIDENGITIAKGALLGFKNIEPIWTTPYAYNSLDPTQPTFYKPEAWYVVGKETNATRLLTFISRPVPDMLKPSYNFGGMSLTQLVEPYVVRWLKTVDSVNRMISNYSIVGVKTNLMASLQEGGDMDGLLRRLAVFNAMRDNRGMFALDKDSEEFFMENSPLSGLSDLQAQAQEHMAAPTHIPLVKLTGITPSGLNASSDGEIKVFYDFIAAEQENLCGPHLTTMLQIVQLHLWGKVDPDIGYEWVPLDSPTDKEMSDMRTADGKRDTDYINGGVLDPEEVRTRLKNDPNSGYTGITGSAPTPPDIEGKETDHKLGEAAAEGAQARGEESAEAAAKREADAREHQSKLDAKAPKVKK